MFFLFSGEGPTDLGLCAGNTASCDGEDYEYGPMTVVVDQLVEEKHGYSLLEFGQCGYVSKGTLIDQASELKAAKKSPRLPGKKRDKETRYFFNNARVLAQIATDRQNELNDEVVAVLFRDSDGTASAGRGTRAEKWKSMMDGFSQEGFSRGVPMIPEPTSKAWLLCALGKNPHAKSASQEYSGMKKSNALKKELEEILGQPASRIILCELVADGTVNINSVDTGGFADFRQRLEDVI